MLVTLGCLQSKGAIIRSIVKCRIESTNILKCQLTYSSREGLFKSSLTDNFWRIIWPVTWSRRRENFQRIRIPLSHRPAWQWSKKVSKEEFALSTGKRQGNLISLKIIFSRDGSNFCKEQVWMIPQETVSPTWFNCSLFTRRGLSKYL